MPRHAPERILVIGDNDRQIHSALVQAMPGAYVSAVPSYFDAIAELVANPYTAVLAAAEPIERRPEAAVKTLRQLAGDGRVLLFGHPTLEPLSRKMLDFGCDDYLVTPTTPGELQQIFGTPSMRLTDAPADGGTASEPVVSSPPTKVSTLLGLPLADILDALIKNPHDSPAAAVRQLNDRIAPVMRLALAAVGSPPPVVTEEMLALAHPVRSEQEDIGVLHLFMPRDEEETAGRHFLSQLAGMIGKIGSLQDRHNRLQKLAITDDLTGVYNGRYFRHFLARIIEKARGRRFPVTLLLFDIDNFKKYNDQFGHGVGDEILKQTASLMKRCCRDHDLVARISGDEFAVVFWEKDGPRQARDPNPAPAADCRKLPRERFRRLIASSDFQGLGASGKGMLTISGGLAVYPYDATDMTGLIQAADKKLMFGAKQSGKNSIVLVGNDQIAPPVEDTGESEPEK